MESFGEKVSAFIEANKSEGMSQAMLARNTGYTAGVLSQVVNDKYPGDSETVRRKVRMYIDNYNKQGLKSSEATWVETKQTRMAHIVYQNAIRDKHMAVIHGVAGVGKSELAKRVVSRHPNAIYIEIVKGQTTRDVLRDLIAHLKTTPKRSNYDTFVEICDRLRESDRFIIIDQAEFLRNDTIEIIRAIWDRTQTTIILVGIDEMLDRLREHQHLYSRIKWRWHVQLLQNEEIVSMMESYGLHDVTHLASTVAKLANRNWRSTAYLVQNALEIAGGKGVDEQVFAVAKEMLLL